MKDTLRKTICLLSAAAALIAGCVLLGSVLKYYSHTVPVIISPHRQAALTLLFTLLIVSLGFYFRPLNKRTFFAMADETPSQLLARSNSLTSSGEIFILLDKLSSVIELKSSDARSSSFNMNL